MDIFWCNIKYVELDVNWLLKVKTHLDKLEKTTDKQSALGHNHKPNPKHSFP